MTDKELRRLSKENLLQIMIDQQKRIEQLEAELEAKDQALAEKAELLDSSASISATTQKLETVLAETEKQASTYIDDLKYMIDNLELRLGDTPVRRRRRVEGKSE